MGTATNIALTEGSVSSQPFCPSSLTLGLPSQLTSSPLYFGPLLVVMRTFELSRRPFWPFWPCPREGAHADSPFSIALAITGQGQGKRHRSLWRSAIYHYLASLREAANPSARLLGFRRRQGSTGSTAWGETPCHRAWTFATVPYSG